MTYPQHIVADVRPNVHLESVPAVCLLFQRLPYSGGVTGASSGYLTTTVLGGIVSIELFEVYHRLEQSYSHMSRQSAGLGGDYPVLSVAVRCSPCSFLE